MIKALGSVLFGTGLLCLSNVYAVTPTVNVDSNTTQQMEMLDGDTIRITKTVPLELVKAAESRRLAILVHPNAGKNGKNQTIAVDFMARHTYQTLLTRGFAHNDIYFLSHTPDLAFSDEEGTNAKAVDAPVTLSQVQAGTATARDVNRHDIQAAFDWAAEQGELDEPLLVVFIDHGVPEGLLLNNPLATEVFKSDDLKTLFDSYQAKSGNALVAIFEACHSGTLTDDLAAPNRLVVTSTNDNLAYYDELGHKSFLKLYMDELRRGESFQQSFDKVRGTLAGFRKPLNQQVPQLVDASGTLAEQHCLNGCFGTLPGVLTLTADISATAIMANTPVEFRVTTRITGGTVRRVWASVIEPQQASRRDHQGYSVVATPTAYMRQINAELWTMRYSSFYQSGTYTFNANVEDNNYNLYRADLANVALNAPLIPARLNLMNNSMNVPVLTVGTDTYGASLSVLSSQMPMLLQVNSLTYRPTISGTVISNYDTYTGIANLPLVEVTQSNGSVITKKARMTLVPGSNPMQFHLQYLP